MSTDKILTGLFSAIVVLSLSVSPCAAHDMGLDGDTIVKPETSVAPDEEALDGEFGDDAETVRGVLDGFKLWPSGKVLDVCFLNGAENRRAFFAESVKSWLDGTSLKADFGATPAFRTCDRAHLSDMRISFARGGSWSFVGTDSLKFAPGRASLNIDYALSGPLDSYDLTKFKRLILHEFGHAIGFEHEHQSPEARCDAEFDWDYLYNNMGWGKQTVDRNMKALVAGPRANWITTPYDQTSIMHYALPEKFFKKGTQSQCFVPENNDLSKVDKELALKTYPPAPENVPVASNDAILQERADATSAALSSLELPPEQLGKIGVKIADILIRGQHNLQKKLTLDFDAAPPDATRGLGDAPEIKDCSEQSKGISCAFTSDGSQLSISIDPK